MIYLAIIWPLASLIVAFALCRCIRKSKVRDEIGAGTNWVLIA